jgi:hypothetical protein
MSCEALTASEKAKIALRVYRDRGRLALEALDREDVAEFFSLLDKRRAAFHNFRALDHLARTEGVDLAQDDEVKQIWHEIQESNSRLETISEQAISDMESRASRLTKGRAISQKYGSGNFNPCKLRKFG